MRLILIILTTVMFSTLVRAEYNGYHIKFELETTTGETTIGYVYVASAYLNTDSLKNTNYLKKALDQSWKEWNKRDSLAYFKERIKYKYRNVGHSLGEKIPIYALNNKQVISSQEIKSIAIVELIDYTYVIGISSPLSILDTIWINKKALRSYSFEGYLCYHQIFVHENSKKIENLIKRLKKNQEQLKYVEIDNDDKVDKDIWKIIEELYGEKVIVITECSC